MVTKFWILTILKGYQQVGLVLHEHSTSKYTTKLVSEINVRIYSIFISVKHFINHSLMFSKTVVSHYFITCSTAGNVSKCMTQSFSWLKNKTANVITVDVLIC